MNRRNAIQLLVVAALSAAALTAAANGLRLASQDAFASARGEAFVATADNASAIYYNPAGISQLQGNNIRGGFYGLYLDPSFTPPESARNHDDTYHSSHKLAAAGQFFYACTPGESPLSFGLGVYAPFGGNVDWPQDTGFRAVATKGSLTYVTINPVVALKLAPGFSIGGGLGANYAELNLEQGLRARQGRLADHFRFLGHGWSVGYNLGALWQPQEKVSLGVTFRGAAPVTLEGQTEVERLPVIPLSLQPARADYTFPLTAVFGLSYRPTPKWNLEFDADYTEWSSFGTTIIHQSKAPFGIPQDIHLIMDWEPSWMYELGVTRYFDSGWHVSAGYVYNQNSVPDAHYTPFAADLDRHFLSVGTGFKGERFDFDVAYQFGYGPARTVTGSTPSTAGQIAGQTADGTYRFISHAVLLTAGMHF